MDDAAGDPSPLPAGQPQQQLVPAGPAVDPAEEVTTESMKKYVTDLWNRELDRLLDLHLEVFFLENAGTITEFAGWKKKPPADLIRQYLQTNSAEQDVLDLFSSRVPALPDPLHHGHLTIGSGGGPGAGSAASGHLLSSPARVSSSAQLNSHPDGRPDNAVTAAAASTAASSGSGHVVTGVLPALPAPLSSSQHAPSTVQKASPHSSHRSGISEQSTPQPGDSAGGTPQPRPPPLHRITQKAQRSAAKVSNSSIASPHRTHMSSSGAAAYASRAHATRQQSISAVYESSIGSQEQIVEKAKQEAHVMNRIDQLRREGLWMPKRLPKCQDPPREKAHWDYLLEEMHWLSTDFAQERKWKKSAAKKCAAMVMKYHRDKEAAAERAKRDEQSNLKKIASSIAKEVRNFWSLVEKLAEAKQNSIIEKKKKQAADMHLKLIVDQTEEYTTWLTEGLRKEHQPDAPSLTATDPDEERMATDCDDDFRPDQEEADDEETIAREEREADGHADHQQEIAELNRENDLPLEQLIPPGYISSSSTAPHPSSSTPEASTSDLVSESALCSAGVKRKRDDDDEEFRLGEGDDEEDDEKTIAEQEAKESANYSEEIQALEEDNELSQEELIAKYYSGFSEEADPVELDAETEEEEDGDDEDSSRMDEAESPENSQEDDDETEEDETQQEDEEEEEQEEIGIEFLTKPDAGPSKTTDDSGGSDGSSPSKKGPGRAITDIAAAVEEIQPKGNTLSTACVVTPVPFLLKHSLREYQHIGLDWLVAMNEKKLNGILADEMGLGKTIQTIALLAHLACEKGIWGPHLIVVPTSVMLNWEMEFKKWCPAFKTMTYYGSPKERKAKRQGWTKSNQFHVCITSYKLVIQDQSSFRRKKWRYLILDEAQHIKNFKSQRWQTLLNFKASRRLLLTGTPLQNNLMELWSLMHFLMPNVFASHRDFKDWFVNPVAGMIDGQQEYNEELVRRLHKILRPFLLRRLKKDVEKQLPQKHEHVILCKLSKRQRFLYEEFMSLSKTKETLASGNFLSVINVLMQLRKVCNHPNLFESRPITSPFAMEGLTFETSSLATTPLIYDPLRSISLDSLNFNLLQNSLTLTAFSYNRIQTFKASSKLIQEIDSAPEPEPRIPRGKIRLQITSKSNNSLLSNRPSPCRKTAADEEDDSSEPDAKKRRTDSTTLLDSSLARAPLTANRSSVTVEDMSASNPAARNPLIRKLAIKNPVNSAGAPTRVQFGSLHISPNGQRLELNSQPTATHTNNSGTTTAFIQSIFELERLKKVREDERRQKLKFLSDLNELRCSAETPYPSDLIEIFTLNRSPVNVCTESQEKSIFNVGQGYFHCLHKGNNKQDPRNYMDFCNALMSVIRTPDELTSDMVDILKRFVMIVPPVSAPRTKIHTSHPSPSEKLIEEVFEHKLQEEVNARSQILHTIVSNTKAQFPELRLIQYDCGKLQTLDKLLWDLKSGAHRVLIFTQMSRMLDIFEQFLNYHGHTYLRLDGATKIEQRQALMERFNADKKIFCFILSTRSGGVGVNLTGADTVIFYDSDWNPTMDAQAQDRCHRIGQTRDVHIYRLISERTVEENILKKAQQKKLLGDLAIEEGNFTTAFFKQNAVRDLFGEGMSGTGHDLRDMLEAQNSQVPSPNAGPAAADSAPVLQEWEKAIEKVEEREDIVAAKTSKAEANAELAEFDENVPLDNEVNDVKEEDDELQRLIDDLSPLEMYALKFLESTEDHMDQLKQAEEEIEMHKKDWEMGHLKSLKEEQERNSDSNCSESEDMLTMPREAATNQMFMTPDGSIEELVTWAPPTPPQDNSDVYIDHTSAFMYERTTMTESELPPVYIPREPAPKRFRLEHPSASPRVRQKAKKEDVITFPRSLFDRPSAAVMRLRRELKALKMRGQLVGGPDSSLIQRIMSLLGPNQTLATPLTLLSQLQSVKQPHVMLSGLQADTNIPWNIMDEWLILQVIQQIQELPTNLVVISPAHTPNWDMISDTVSSTTHNFRSSRLCRHRYEQHVVPREEGRTSPAVGTDLAAASQSKKKQKKVPQQPSPLVPAAPVPGPAVVPPVVTSPKSRVQKTKILFATDDHVAFTAACNGRIDVMGELAGKRQTMKETSVKPIFERVGVSGGKGNPKHIEILQQNGIAYEVPVMPAVIATNRLDRMTKEKAKSVATQQAAEAAARQKAQLMQKQNQMKQQQQQQQQMQPQLQAAVAATVPKSQVSQQSQHQQQFVGPVVVQQPQQPSQQQYVAPVVQQQQVPQTQKQYVGAIQQQSQMQHKYAAAVQQSLQQQQQQQPVLQVQAQVTVGQRVVQAFSPSPVPSSPLVRPATPLSAGPSTPVTPNPEMDKVQQLAKGLMQDADNFIAQKQQQQQKQAQQQAQAQQQVQVVRAGQLVTTNLVPGNVYNVNVSGAVLTTQPQQGVQKFPVVATVASGSSPGVRGLPPAAYSKTQQASNMQRVRLMTQVPGQRLVHFTANPLPVSVTSAVTAAAVTVTSPIVQTSAPQQQQQQQQAQQQQQVSVQKLPVMTALTPGSQVVRGVPLATLSKAHHAQLQRFRVAQQSLPGMQGQRTIQLTIPHQVAVSSAAATAGTPVLQTAIAAHQVQQQQVSQQQHVQVVRGTVNQAGGQLVATTATTVLQAAMAAAHQQQSQGQQQVQVVRGTVQSGQLVTATGLAPGTVYSMSGAVLTTAQPRIRMPQQQPSPQQQQQLPQQQQQQQQPPQQGVKIIFPFRNDKPT